MHHWLGYLIIVVALLVGLASGRMLSRQERSACPCGPECRCTPENDCGCQAAARRLKAAAGVGVGVQFFTGEPETEPPLTDAKGNPPPAHWQVPRWKDSSNGDGTFKVTCGETEF